MNEASSALWSRRVGIGIALAALAGYLVTLSPTFYPGASAVQVAQHLGVTPFPALGNILWGWLLRLVALIPFGSLAVRLNLLSALCAAGAVYLIYLLMMSIHMARLPDLTGSHRPSLWVQMLGAGVAACYLACSIPFWVVATRAHPLPFDLLLGLFPFWLVQRSLGRPGNRLIFLASFIYGLGVTEHSTLVALGPVLGLHILIVLLAENRLTVGALAGALGSFLLGLLPFLAAAWIYQQSAAYVWRSFSGLDQVLKYILLEQWNALSRGLPRVGWLAYGFLTLLPWVIAFGYRRTPRPVDLGNRCGQGVVHLLLAGVLIGVLWDMPLSPWRSTQGEPLILLPYVLAAMAMGFVTAFWVELLSGNVVEKDRLSRPSWILGLLLFLVPVAAAVHHLPITSGRSGVLVDRYLSALLDSQGPRRWMITSGEHDAHLALLARERGQDITFVNPRMSQAIAYQNYMASLFDQPRLQGLARVGLAPLLQEWLAQGDVLNQMTAVGSSDLWEALGFDPLPQGLLYIGLKADEARDPAVQVELFHRLVRGWADDLRAAAASDLSPAARYYAGLLQELSRLANNLGVYAEEQGRADLAESLYRESRAFNPANLSAVINLTVLGRRVDLADREELGRVLDKMVKEQEGDYTLWSLSRLHGYVRTPEIYASRGWAWTMSGKPGMAVRELRRAVKAGGDTPARQLALAQLYFAQDDDQASEAAYRKLLAVNPDHVAAMLGLVRLAARRGDFQEARHLLARARPLAANQEALMMEDAAVEAAAGDAGKATVLLSEVVKRRPEDARAWMALALTATQRGDAALADSALVKLQNMKTMAPSVRFALAQMAFTRRDVASARRQLEELLRVQPAHVGGLTLMAQISQMDGDRRQLEQYVTRLLSADPASAYGNYLLGSFQYLREQYALAEASYRASLAAQRTPDALNALAYLQLLKGELGEAETLVREALKMDEALPMAWDTLANVLIRKKKLDEAEQAAQKAVAMRPKEASVQVTLVRLYEAQGKVAEAARLADELLARANELTAGDRQDLRDLLKRVRSGS